MREFFSHMVDEIAPFLWILLLILIFYQVKIHRKKLTIVLKTLPRDLRFLTAFWLTQKQLKNYKEKNLTILDLFQYQVKKRPDKVLIYFEEEKWTFREMDLFSNRVGNAFKGLRFDKGDVVALLMPTCVEYIGIWFGLAKIGVVTALLNLGLTNQSLAHCLRMVNVKAVIYSSEFESAIREVLPSMDYYFERYLWGGPRDEDGVVNLVPLVEAASAELPIPRTPMEYREKAVYAYTSGTTEFPKAAIIRHYRLLFMSAAVFYVLGLREKDIVYNPLPLYHTAGGLLGVVGPLSHGFSLVLKRKFSASSYWPDCIKYNCTVAQYIGEMCRYVLSVPPRPEDVKHKVRFVFGNGMRYTLWRNFEKRFNLKKICEIYGSTEGNTNLVNLDRTVGAVGFLPRILPERWLPMGLIRVDEHGEPVRNSRGLCIKCRPHQPGMLVGIIKTTDAMRDYSGFIGTKKDSTIKVLKCVFKPGDRAFLSGDIMIMDKLGYLYFKGRTGDTFRWKGENVSTVEVEEIISSVVGLRDVMVYGVEVANFEGRVGMMAIVDPQHEINVKSLTVETSRILPPYARPIFLRITKQAELTETFKLKKLNFQQEGCDPSKIEDKLYFKNKATGYIELTKEMYEDIIAGKVKM